MSDFKGRHFRGEIVLWAVRWYCRYPISYRDLEAMMTERGVAVDHSTIYRWVQRFPPEMEKRLRWQWRRPQSRSWRVDETYIKVRGKWAYLYRAVDKLGNTIDFYLSATRNTKAAKRFLGKALRGLTLDSAVAGVGRPFLGVDFSPPARPEAVGARADAPAGGHGGTSSALPPGSGASDPRRSTAPHFAPGSGRSR